MMLRHPYLASAIARLPIISGVDAPWCGTAATDGYHIVVNEEFLATLDDTEAEFVLAHELLHCILDHTDRRGARDRSTWNLATDFAINQTLVELGFWMPRSGLMDGRFRGLPAETIYETLERHEPTGAAMSLTSPAIDRHARFPEEAAVRVRMTLTENQTRRLVALGGWDIHLDPVDPEGRGILGRDMPTRLERLRLGETFRNALMTAVRGRQAGFVSEEVRAAARPSVSWVELLARFIGGVRLSDYRTYPFNKKQLHRGLYLPTTGAPGPSDLVVAMDTSGSIGPALARQFLAEVDRIRALSGSTITLLQCDTRIQSATTFDSWEDTIFGDDRQSMAIRGRGGTDFRPVFEWVNHSIAIGPSVPDAIIYLTDGYGTFPTAPPQPAVLWAIPARAALADGQFPFGEVIHLDPLPA